MDNWTCGARQGSPSSIEARDAAEAPQPQLLHLRPHATHEPWPRLPPARAREIVASRSTLFSLFFDVFLHRCMHPAFPQTVYPK